MASRIHLPVLAASVVALFALTAAGAQERSVDETALRHYAARGEVKRVEAEGRRLAVLHPGWTMPADIWSTRQGRADEKPLWALFSRDDLDGLKRAIAARRQSEPGWQPSDDLARKLRRKELRIAILGKAGAAQWLGVSELAGEFGKGDDVDDVELAWAVAEGLARSDRQPEAFALYSAVLTRRTAPAERRATIQKAIALLPISDVELLLAMGKTSPDGSPEFAALALDITRARISAILHDERKEPIEPAELTAFSVYARQAEDASQPGLIAWLALKQNRPTDALDWFKLAIGRGSDAMVAHGLAHTLLRLNMRREAEEVAFAWREPLVNNAILFIDVLESDLTRPAPPAIEPERLARYARVTLDTRSGEGAQALGWYAYNACQFGTALDWFRRASAWMPKEATIYGQALSLQRLKRQRDFVELVNRYDGLFPSVVALVFHDGRDDGPGPCEPQAARKADAVASGTVQAIRVPQPDAATPVPVRRADFPIAVSPENPLRFPDAAAPANEAARPVGSETRPLVARRVPGVTAMPYERLGFALLPGWNGVNEPSGFASAEIPPARGTLWAQGGESPRDGTAPAAPQLAGAGDTAAARFKR